MLYCEQLPRFTAVVMVARCVGFIQRLGHWLAGLGPAGGGSMRPGGVSAAGKVGDAARIVLGLISPRWLQMTYHATGGECRRNRACKVRSWSFEGLDWTWEQVGDWTVCTYAWVYGGCLGGRVGFWS
jgi:hypothetical protein